MTTVMNLNDPTHKIEYSCSPEDAVIAACVQSKKDWNTWQYKERYSHLLEYGVVTVFCGDFSAFKDGRDF